MATKTAKKADKKVTAKDRFNTVKDAVKNVNEFAYTTTEDIVEGTIATGEQWTKIASKAVKGGIKLADEQQEIVLSALESMKEQVVKNGKRLRNIFRNKK